MLSRCGTRGTGRRGLRAAGKCAGSVRAGLAAVALVLASVRGAEGPLAAWDFDEGEGDTLHDRVGTAHGLIRGPAWVRCGKGFALRFDGVDDVVEFGDPPALRPAEAVTVEAWVLPERVPTSGEPGVVGKAYHNYVLTYYTDGKCWWYIGQGGSNVKSAVTPGAWHHVVGTYDGSTLCLYIDGALADRRPAKTTGPVPAGAGFFMGASEGEAQYTKGAHFCGLLDDAAVYGRALSEAEVRERYLTTHVTGAAEVTAFADVGARGVSVRASLRGLGALGPGASADIDLRRAGRRRTVAKTSLPVPGDGGVLEARLDTGGLEPGDYVVRVQVRNAEGEPVGEPAEAGVAWPAMPGWDTGDRRIRVLNALVSELRSVGPTRRARTVVDFTNPRPGWVFFRAWAEPGSAGRTALVLPETPGADTRVEVPETGSRTVEAMRRLPAGKHAVTVECTEGGALAGLVIRAIPELGYCRVDCGPQIKAYGACDWPFLEEHILPHINLAVSRGAEGERARWEAWRRQGKRWVVETPLVGLGKRDGVSADEVEQGWLANGRLEEPLLDGVIVDEFAAGDDPIWASWHEAVRRIRDNPRCAGKVFYPYCGPLFGAPASRAFAQTIQEAGWAVALERYLPEEPTEAAARAAVQTAVVELLRAWEKAQPGITRHTLIVWGFLISAPNESTNVNPAVDFRAFMDLQMNTLANDPACFGLYGVTAYLSAYADEEAIRWYGKLLRHYCIEGRTEPLLRTYALRHITNPDFADGLEGWDARPAEEGTIGTGTADGLSWLQGRYPPTPLGNTYLLLRRSGKGPNVVSQTLQGLTPGALYSAKLITGDRQEYERGASASAAHAVRLEVAGAEVVPEKSFRFPFKSCYSHTFGAFDARNPYWMTLHRVVFRAGSGEARLFITDWGADGTPGGPLGQELMCNFVEVQPYLE